MEYVDTDLAKLINTGQRLSSEHIKCIMLQLLAALKYMHSAQVLHRDLKPENVLVTESCEVKVPLRSGDPEAEMWERSGACPRKGWGLGPRPVSACTPQWRESCPPARPLTPWADPPPTRPRLRSATSASLVVSSSTTTRRQPTAAKQAQWRRQRKVVAKWRSMTRRKWTKGNRCGGATAKGTTPQPHRKEATRSKGGSNSRGR